MFLHLPEGDGALLRYRPIAVPLHAVQDENLERLWGQIMQDCAPLCQAFSCFSLPMGIDRGGLVRALFKGDRLLIEQCRVATGPVSHEILGDPDKIPYRRDRIDWRRSEEASQRFLSHILGIRLAPDLPLKEAGQARLLFAIEIAKDIALIRTMPAMLRVVPGGSNGFGAHDVRAT